MSEINGLIFYRSYYDAVQELKEKDRQIMYAAIFEYCFGGKTPKLKGHLSGFWKLIQPTIDSSQSRYKASVSNGKKGGRPKKNKPNDNPEITQEKPDIKPSDNLNKDRDKEKDKEKDSDNENNFTDFYNTYIEHSHLKSSESLRLKSEKAWLTLTETERSKASETVKRHATRIFKDYGSDMKFVQRPHTFLTDKIFNTIKPESPPLIMTKKTGLDGIPAYSFKDAADKRYPESATYFNKETRTWHVK